jgi:hypothetical protein
VLDRTADALQALGRVAMGVEIDGDGVSGGMKVSGHAARSRTSVSLSGAVELKVFDILRDRQLGHW